MTIARYRLIAAAVAALLAAAVATAQDAPAPAPARKPAAATTVKTTKEGPQDDPGYPLYKKAYGMVLREEWEGARKAFRELVAKYPRSEYRDDAEYWTAYSWRDSDLDRAKEAYRDFLKKYRSSSYFDDALADFDQMIAHSLAVAAPAMAAVPPMTPRVAVSPRAVSVFPDDSAFTLTMRSLPPAAVAPAVKIRRMGRLFGTPVPVPGHAWAMPGGEDLDDETRLRLETLYAVGNAGADEKGFGAIRAIAVSTSEKPVVRAAAMEALASYRGHDAIPVFVEIAKNDTSEEMQLYAIESIGSAAPDREKAFVALKGLYDSVPASSTGKRKMVFYSIAEIGNDRAVEFLAGVAKTGRDPELRREAIYYLGTIGGEKARAVLIDLLGGGR